MRKLMLILALALAFGTVMGASVAPSSAQPVDCKGDNCK